MLVQVSVMVLPLRVATRFERVIVFKILQRRNSLSRYWRNKAVLAFMLPALVLPPSGHAVDVSVDQKKGKFDVTSSEADLLVNWDTAPLGLDHPRLGRIGPFPYRRTGGHTGKNGVAYFSDRDGVEAVEAASSFDVVPTIIEMLGKEPHPGVSGRSFVTQ